MKHVVKTPEYFLRLSPETPGVIPKVITSKLRSVNSGPYNWGMYDSIVIWRSNSCESSEYQMGLPLETLVMHGIAGIALRIDGPDRYEVDKAAQWEFETFCGLSFGIFCF